MVTGSAFGTFHRFVMMTVITALLLCCGFGSTLSAETAQDENIPVAEFPFEITSNIPFVQVSINGTGPYWFVLDTGSAQASLLDYDIAGSLGLELQNETETHIGAGEGAAVKIAFVNGIDLDIHGLKLVNQSALAIELKHVSEYEGRSLDGTLGFNFLSLYVVEIDYANNKIRLYDPASYAYHGNGHTIPFEFISQLPAIGVVISMPGMDPINTKFIVDTGTRMAFLFNTPFVKDHGFLDADTNFLLGTVGGGVGGEAKGYVGRIDSMQVGPFLVNEPVVVMSADTSGVTAMDLFDGIVGGELLRRTRTTLDYSRKQIILEPYAASPQPYEYDMSGMFIIAKGPDYDIFTIQSVIDGSPADDAGLQVGDVIVAVDGNPAGNYSLEQVKDMLKIDGKEINLQILRENDKFDVKLKLRRLV